MHSHPNILKIEVEEELPPKQESGHRTFLHVTTDAEIDPLSPNYDPALVFAIKAAAIHDWVDVQKQQPETEVRLFHAPLPPADVDDVIAKDSI